jgi:hypothetical protein
MFYHVLIACNILVDFLIVSCNDILSFEHIRIGFYQTKFFGYVCEQCKFKMDPDRFKAVREIPFPEGFEQLLKMRFCLNVTRRSQYQVKEGTSSSLFFAKKKLKKYELIFKKFKKGELIK